MHIAGLVKSSTVDFPGRLSAVVFFGGCNFNCYYCHNALLINEPPKMDETEVLRFLERRAGLLEGVVLSGGEPSLQADLPEFARRVKGMGYAVKLDTNGSRPEMLKALILGGLVDYAAMDYKAPLQMYRQIAGAPASGFLESLEIIRAIEHELRVTVIPELTPGLMLEMAKSLPKVGRYALQLYRPPHLGAPANVYSPAKLNEIADMIRPFQPNVVVRA